MKKRWGCQWRYGRIPAKLSPPLHLIESVSRKILTPVLLPRCWQPIIWAVVADSREKEKGRLRITYGPEDTVVALDPVLVEARQRFLRAACGSVTAQYMAGYEYEYGLGVSRNLVKAYVWYSISAANGRTEANTQRDKITLKMTPEQLTAANNLVKTWSPPDCSELCGGKP